MDKTMDKTIELIKEKLAQVEKIEPMVKIMPLKSVAVILTQIKESIENEIQPTDCLLYTSPSPRD